MRNALSAKIVGIAAAAACALWAAQKPASAVSAQQLCENWWTISSASDYCPNASITWVKKAWLTCNVTVHCAVDVKVGGNTQRLSGVVGVDMAFPRGLKLCIRRTSHELFLGTDCGSGTDAATAEEEGLPAR